MKKITLLCLILIVSAGASATHLRAGYITARQDAVNSRKFWITITIFTNSINTSVLVGGEDDILDFGDGSDPDHDGVVGILVPETANTPRPDIGSGVNIVTITIEHTYEQLGDYLISYSEPNRNEGIINMSNSVSTRFYLETYINPQADELYVSPQPLAEPLSRVSLGKNFTLSLAASDDNYRLRYQLAVPKQARYTPVSEYKLPGSMHMNPYNGLLSWDSRFENQLIEGEFTFAAKIVQLTTVNEYAGYVHMDFQLIVQEAEASPDVQDTLDLDENSRLYVAPGTSTEFLVIGQAADGGSQALSFHSPFSDEDDVVNFESFDSLIDGRIHKVAILRITSDEAIGRDEPYPITVRMKSMLDGHAFIKDVSYLFLTRDIQLTDPDPRQNIPVGVSESESTFAIYPNPATTKVSVKSRSHVSRSFKITDASGNVFSRLADDDGTFDVSDLPAGVYVVQEASGGKIVRIVKQ
jgi:hypothetical protein